MNYIIKDNNYKNSDRKNNKNLEFIKLISK